MTNPPDREVAIFSVARRLPAAERAAYLDRTCGGDAALRQRAEELLQASEKAGAFLRESAPGAQRPVEAASEADSAPTVPSTLPAEQIGERIGRYKLLQLIGEGGCGVVYMAEQEEPVHRRVALKVIKLGMDTKSVIARFEAERQALALMDHPNIAKVFDAGATNTGRPFFVMELVRGIKITDYCDQNNLPTRQRLDLFVQVCQAIQHAHQKGVIHRDIKPSNILVTLRDSVPVPKVIDFGIAKATNDQRLTDKTLFTAFEQFIGTPAYMSPEQAEMSELGIDTRSDIYSLGVLLYELLTGQTPFDAKELLQAGLDAMRRIIREQEPARPSTRLSTLLQVERNRVANHRQTDPLKLVHLLRGDLDWIVIKSLEKDRVRRYETANGLARDIQRHLNDEPVEACPPGAGYRLGKFLRRHKGPALAGSMVVLALAGGIVGTTWGLVRAERARQAEATERAAAGASETKAIAQKRVAEAVGTFLQQDLLRQAIGTEQADTVRRLGGEFEAKDNPTIKELLNRASTELTPEKIEAKFPRQREVQSAILRTVGDAFQGIGEYAKAVELLTRASNLYREDLGPNDPDTLATMDNLAQAYQSLGKLPEAIALLERVRVARVATLGAEHQDSVNSLARLGWAYQAVGKLDQAIEMFEQVRDSNLKKLGAERPDALSMLNNLGLAYQDAGRLAEATKLFEQVREASVQKLGADHPDTLVSIGNLALAYKAGGRLPEAIQLFEQVRDGQVKKLGADHPFTLINMNNLASAYDEAGRVTEAISLFEHVLDARIKKLGPDHPDILYTLNNLASAYQAAGRLPQAIELLEQVRQARIKKLGPDHPSTLLTLNNLGWAYQEDGKLELALPLLREAAEGMQKREFRHDYAAMIVPNLSGCLERLEQYAEAETWARSWLAAVKEQNGPESQLYARALAGLGLNLLKQQRWTEAEVVLQECLTAREKTQPDLFATFSTKSLLGASLLGQKRYAQAEPLLLAGYAGMEQREDRMPCGGDVRLLQTIERLVQLYQATDRPQQAAEWKKKLP